jgi:hypothetical protein
MPRHNPRRAHDGTDATGPGDSEEVKKMLDIVCKAVWKVCGNAFTHEGLKRNLGDESFPIFLFKITDKPTALERRVLRRDCNLFSDECTKIVEGREKDDEDDDEGDNQLSHLALDDRVAKRIAQAILADHIQVVKSNYVNEDELNQDSEVEWVDL